MWHDARTAIVLGMNYGPDHDPMGNLDARHRGNISVYARGRDYHEVIKGKLKQLAGRLAAKTGWQVRVFVDTAPLMEKPLGQSAGIDKDCLLYTSPSPRDRSLSRMPSSA